MPRLDLELSADLGGVSQLRLSSVLAGLKGGGGGVTSDPQVVSNAGFLSLCLFRVDLSDEEDSQRQ